MNKREYPFKTIETENGTIVNFTKEDVRKYLEYMANYW